MIEQIVSQNPFPKLTRTGKIIFSVLPWMIMPGSDYIEDIGIIVTSSPSAVLLLSRIPSEHGHCTHEYLSGHLGVFSVQIWLKMVNVV